MGNNLFLEGYFTPLKENFIFEGLACPGKPSCSTKDVFL